MNDETGILVKGGLNKFVTMGAEGCIKKLDC
jgi:hypothetical protein